MAMAGLILLALKPHAAGRQLVKSSRRPMRQSILVCVSWWLRLHPDFSLASGAEAVVTMDPAVRTDEG
ncbi:hypothetical protein MGYG_04812 [Nannizzia gypsea CBS 118893]|uniref:Uncharacterized protein n=1 Tax=Arthroderma gypseum (strain ATCC MYA-4604 / CBS 118893) TaxID=535722 RepID=E4UWV9_ARTGP|nr:hypothetical protein MGYG_04812 [Nannizzia gypsea CBS 118893]EFR01812.1 hypothetical protein MGYG_04812 [Nannizzia gypsea CBS 118893]